MSAIAQIVVAALLIGVAIGVGTLLERASEGGAKNVGTRLLTATSLDRPSDSPDDGRGAGEALPPFERIALRSGEPAPPPNSIVHLGAGDFWVSPVDGKYYRAAMNEAGIWAPLDKDAPGYDADDRPRSPSPLTLVGGVGSRDDDLTATEWIQQASEWQNELMHIRSADIYWVENLLTGHPQQSVDQLALQRFPPEMQSGITIDDYIRGLATPPPAITYEDLVNQTVAETPALDQAWAAFESQAATGFDRLRAERGDEKDWGGEESISHREHRTAYETARNSLEVSQGDQLEDARWAGELVDQMRRAVAYAPTLDSLTASQARFESAIDRSPCPVRRKKLCKACSELSSPKAVEISAFASGSTSAAKQPFDNARTPRGQHRLNLSLSSERSTYVLTYDC